MHFCVRPNGKGGMGEESQLLFIYYNTCPESCMYLWTPSKMFFFLLNVLFTLDQMCTYYILTSNCKVFMHHMHVLSCSVLISHFTNILPSNTVSQLVEKLTKLNHSFNLWVIINVQKSVDIFSQVFFQACFGKWGMLELHKWVVKILSRHVLYNGVGLHIIKWVINMMPS